MKIEDFTIKTTAASLIEQPTKLIIDCDKCVLNSSRDGSGYTLEIDLKKDSDKLSIEDFSSIIIDGIEFVRK